MSEHINSGPSAEDLRRDLTLAAGLGDSRSAALELEILDHLEYRVLPKMMATNGPEGFKIVERSFYWDITRSGLEPPAMADRLLRTRRVFRALRTKFEI